MADCNRNCCNDCGRERKYPCDTNFREAVCVHTDKIYDSCRDKDCLENVRVYLTSCGQDIVDRAINVKCTKAEVIWVFTDIEAVPFNRGFYSVDLKYFFKVTLAVFTGVGRPTEVEGLATFDKKVILFGSEGNAKVFESKYKEDAFDPQLWRKTNMPHAVVEVADCKMAGNKNAKPAEPVQHATGSSDVSVKFTMYVFNVQNSIYLRKYAEENSENICTIPWGEPVGYIEDVTNGFYKIKYKGQIGYAKAEYLTSTDPHVYTGGNPIYHISGVQNSVYLRKTPSEPAEYICEIPVGAAVEYLGSYNGYDKVYYNGMVGYVTSAYVR